MITVGYYLLLPLMKTPLRKAGMAFDALARMISNSSSLTPPSAFTGSLLSSEMAAVLAAAPSLCCYGSFDYGSADLVGLDSTILSITLTLR